MNALLERDTRSILGFAECSSHHLSQRPTCLSPICFISNKSPVPWRNPYAVDDNAGDSVQCTVNILWRQAIVASPCSFYTSPGKPLQPLPKVLLACQTQQSLQHLALKCDHDHLQVMHDSNDKHTGKFFTNCRLDL